eukprot:gene1181-2300_t
MSVESQTDSICWAKFPGFPWWPVQVYSNWEETPQFNKNCEKCPPDHIIVKSLSHFPDKYQVMPRISECLQPWESMDYKPFLEGIGVSSKQKLNLMKAIRVALKIIAEEHLTHDSQNDLTRILKKEIEIGAIECGPIQIAGIDGHLREDGLVSIINNNSDNNDDINNNNQYHTLVDIFKSLSGTNTDPTSTSTPSSTQIITPSEILSNTTYRGLPLSEIITGKVLSKYAKGSQSQGVGTVDTVGQQDMKSPSKRGRKRKSLTSAPSTSTATGDNANMGVPGDESGSVGGGSGCGNGSSSHQQEDEDDSDIPDDDNEGESIEPATTAVEVAADVILSSSDSPQKKARGRPKKSLDSNNTDSNNKNSSTNRKSKSNINNNGKDLTNFNNISNNNDANGSSAGIMDTCEVYGGDGKVTSSSSSKPRGRPPKKTEIDMESDKDSNNKNGYIMSNNDNDNDTTTIKKRNKKEKNHNNEFVEEMKDDAGEGQISKAKRGRPSLQTTVSNGIVKKKKKKKKTDVDVDANEQNEEEDEDDINISNNGNYHMASGVNNSSSTDSSSNSNSSSELLSEIWSCRLYQRLLFLCKYQYKESSEANRLEMENELTLSIMGAPVWSDDWFVDEENSMATTSTSVSDSGPVTGAVDTTSMAVTVGMKTETETETIPQTEHDSTSEVVMDVDRNVYYTDNAPQDVESKDVEQQSSLRARSVRSRSNASGHMSLAAQLSQAMDDGEADPHLLVAPQRYSMAGVCSCTPSTSSSSSFSQSQESSSSQQQPFHVKVHPQVSVLCDIHAHLSTAEVIGLLAGRWDAESRSLYVQAAFPCAAMERGDNGSTDVELDPVAEFAAREGIQLMGLAVVGWYHSHPRFRPDPSLTDITNQQQYQRLLRDDSCGLEPFIGLIISTYDIHLTNALSVHRWFHVRPYDKDKDLGDEKASGSTRTVLTPVTPLYLPMLITVVNRVGGVSNERYPVRLGGSDKDLQMNLTEGILALSLQVKDKDRNSSNRSHNHRDSDDSVAVVVLTEDEVEEVKPKEQIELDQDKTKEEGSEGNQMSVTIDNSKVDEQHESNVDTEVEVEVINAINVDDTAVSEVVDEKCTGNNVTITAATTADIIATTNASTVDATTPDITTPAIMTDVDVITTTATADDIKPVRGRPKVVKEDKKKVSLHITTSETVPGMVISTDTKAISASASSSAIDPDSSHVPMVVPIPVPIAVDKEEGRRKSSRTPKKNTMLEDFDQAFTFKSKKKKMNKEEEEELGEEEDNNHDVDKLTGVAVATGKKRSVTDLSQSNGIGIRAGSGGVKEIKKITFLQCIQNTSDASILARSLLCSVSAPLRCMMLGIVGLAFYYRHSKHRVDLNARWKGQTKAMKLKDSAMVWARHLGADEKDNDMALDRLFDDVMQLLLQCWALPRGRPKKQNKV